MPPTEPQIFPELELLAASLRGDVRAYTELVERYQRLVWSVALCATGDEHLAEELAQETFITAWNRLPELRDLTKFRSWLCGIARNHARTARRHAERHIPDLSRRSDMPELPSERPTQLDRVLYEEQHRKLGDALAELPDSYRQPLVLFYGEELPVREIAELLDVSEETVRQRLSRGRKQLRVGLAAAVAAAISVRIPEATAAPAVSSTHVALAAGMAAVTAAMIAFVVTIGNGSIGDEPGHASSKAPVAATRSQPLRVEPAAEPEVAPPRVRGRVEMGRGDVAPENTAKHAREPAPTVAAHSDRSRIAHNERSTSPRQKPAHHSVETEVRHGPAVIERPLMRPSVTLDDIR